MKHLKLLFILIVTLAAFSAQAAPVIVHTGSASSAGSTMLLQLNDNAVAGNTLIATVALHNTNTTIITPPSGWTSAVSRSWNGDIMIQIFYRENIPGGLGTNFTFTFNGAFTTYNGYIYEVSGLKPSASLDKTSGSDDGVTGWQNYFDSGTTATTTVASEFYVGTVAQSVSRSLSTAVTNAAGGTATVDFTTAQSKHFRQILTATGAQHCTANFSGNTDWVAVAASFKALDLTGNSMQMSSD